MSVDLTVEGPVAKIVLNRPDKLNALNVELFTALEAEVTRLEQQQDRLAGVVVAMERHIEDLACRGIDTELLGELAAKSIAGVFSRLHLPAGKLPGARQMRPGFALRKEDPIPFDEHGRRDEHGVHAVRIPENMAKVYLTCNRAMSLYTGPLGRPGVPRQRTQRRRLRA